MTAGPAELEDVFLELFRGMPGPDEIQVARDLLYVLDAAGAIEPQMSAVWRARFERIAGGPFALPVRPAEVERRAEAHLQRLLSEVESEPDPENREWARSMASAVTRPLTAVGALSRETGNAFHNRLYETDVLREEPGPDEGWARLIAVVPGPAEPQGGLRISLIELYAAGVLLRWELRRDSHLVLTEPFDPDQPPAALRELTDELGTRYAGPSVGAGGGASTVSHGTMRFRPAVPEGVRELRLRVGLERFVLTLPQRGPDLLS